MLFLENFGMTMEQVQAMLGRALQWHADTRSGIPGYTSWSVDWTAGPIRVECHLKPANPESYGMSWEILCGKGFSIQRYISIGDQKVMGVHMHADGDAKWHLYMSGMRPEPDVDGAGLEDEACLFCVLTNKEEDRHVTVAISDADILPSFVKGSAVTIQVAAFPSEIHYYESIEACTEAHAITTGEGIRMCFAEGVPVGIAGVTQKRCWLRK